MSMLQYLRGEKDIKEHDNDGRLFQERIKRGFSDYE